MADLNKFVEEIKGLSVVELNDLVKKIEEEFGVSAAAMVAAAPAGGAQAAAEGLGEAKALVESAPKAIKENVPVEEAKAMEAKLKEAGAVVELN